MAYDLLIQAEAGLLSVTGTPETPRKTGNSIADIAAGTEFLPGGQRKVGDVMLQPPD